MQRDEDGIAGHDAIGSDEASSDTASARHSVGGPYRDPRDALVGLRRRLGGELAQAERAAARGERVVRQLAVIDDQLRAASAQWTSSIELETSCRARWEEMPGGDAVRRCARCDRDVHDLAQMTHGEIAALFAREDDTPCVRLRRRPDGRVVPGTCPPERGTPRAMPWVAAGAIVALGAGSMLSLTAPVLGGARRRAAEHDAQLERRIAELEAQVALAAVEPHEPAPTTAPSLHDLDRHVRWIAPQAWEIDRALVFALLERPGTTRDGSRLVPHERDGHVFGVRIFGVQPGDLLARLGIESGDTVIDVNGYEMASADRVLEAYARLRDADALFVRLERRGEERVHVYRIVDAR
jgi:hypothetical protein